MKDPGYEIRKAYFNLLNGNLSLNGVNIPVYDRVPPEEKGHYVVISEQTATDESSKGCYSLDTTILFDVVTRYKKGGGKKDADMISNQITEAVIVRYYFPVLEGFKIYAVRLDNSNYLETLEPNNYTVRKLIRVRVYVQQITISVGGFTYTLPFTLA